MGDTRLQEQQNAHFLDVTKTYFAAGFEYGNPQMSPHANNSPNHLTERSRTEGDADHDNMRGVDCSALIWRGLKEAGSHIQAKYPTQAGFTSAALMGGTTFKDYATENFDVVSTRSHVQLDALKPGDIIAFKHGGSNHLGIFEKYDDKGQIVFYGSQTSTGPASATVKPGSYWNKESIFGVLRPKEDFMKARQIEQETPAPPSIAESFREKLDGQLRDKLLAAGCSDKVADAIIAVGVQKCAEQGAQEIKFAGIHLEKNLVLIQTDKKYDSIMYDAVAASKQPVEQSMQSAEQLTRHDPQQMAFEAQAKETQAKDTQTQDTQSRGIGR